MTYAFLFLTYNNPLINIDSLINNNNIYIHPKYPAKINNKYKKYVIKDLIIPTGWCEYSIVSASLNLLKEAIKNELNEWFILLSDDTYLIYDYIEFKTKFKTLHSNRSIFNFKNKYKDYYKTSQWWILNRSDAIEIITSESKYIDRFKHRIDGGCPDEYYFLSVLMWNNPQYKYTNMQVMYDKWLDHTIQKSPFYFNKILEDDINYIRLNNCLFIRKITTNFSLIPYITKKKIYVVYIGTKTIQSNIIFNDNFDMILVISIPISQIDKRLVDRSIYIINIIYKFLYETILNICIEKFILNWDLVIFTTEKFNMNNYNKIDKTKTYLPNNSLKFKNTPLENIKKFYIIHDDLNELAFCIKIKNIKE